MSVSSSNLRKSINIINQEAPQEPKNLKNKIKKQISLQNDIFKNEIYNKLNEGCVLHFIRNSVRKETVKSYFSEPGGEMKYDLCMINKFDENLNNSLSFISEFDLEDEGKEKDSSFDSLDNDDNVEQIDIFEKCDRKISLDKDDEELNDKLEKEWNDIKNILLNKNLS